MLIYYLRIDYYQSCSEWQQLDKLTKNMREYVGKTSRETKTNFKTQVYIGSYHQVVSL